MALDSTFGGTERLNSRMRRLCNVFNAAPATDIKSESPVSRSMNPLLMLFCSHVCCNVHHFSCPLSLKT